MLVIEMLPQTFLSARSTYVIGKKHTGRIEIYIIVMDFLSLKTPFKYSSIARE